jgi:hypothetical protein
MFKWSCYLLPRLALGSILALFLPYGALYIYNEVFPIETTATFPLLTLLFAIICFVIGWMVWSGMGRAILKRFLKLALEAEEAKDLPRAREFYRRGGELLSSSHFAPDAKNPEITYFYQQYIDYLYSKGYNDYEALKVYEKYLTLYPDDRTMFKKILPLILPVTKISKFDFPQLHRLLPEELKPIVPAPVPDKISPALTITEEIRRFEIRKKLISIANFIASNFKILRWLFLGAVVILLTIAIKSAILRFSAESSTDSTKVVIKPYSIQVGAFKDLTRAERALAGLKDLEGVVYIISPSEKSSFYQVRIGYFDTVGEARLRAEELLNRKKISSYFITKNEK